MNSRTKDITGQRVGRLVAIEATDERRRGSVVWLMQCDCGNTCHIAAKNLYRKNTQSCGCLQKEIASSRCKKMVGSLNHNWKPEKTDKERAIDRDYIQYYEWRKVVFERDNYTCRKCGKIGGKLNAHHVEDYANNPSLRTKPSNGVTLCCVCHNNFHHLYGYHSTRAKFNEWMEQ